MPDACADRRRRNRRGGVAIGRTAAISLPLVLVIAACSDDDDAGSDNTIELELAETTEVVRIDVTEPIELGASVDPDFVSGVLADDSVTSDEVTEAYERYIDCLAEGGAVGVYAFDLDLRVAFADWTLPGAVGNDKATLDRSCKRDFLGDLIERFNDSNPAPDDLADRQLDSTVACVRTIDPAIADTIPDDLPLSTDDQSASIVELLDATALGADAGEVDAVTRCIGTFGAPTQEFG